MSNIFSRYVLRILWYAFCALILNNGKISKLDLWKVGIGTPIMITYSVKVWRNCCGLWRSDDVISVSNVAFCHFLLLQASVDLRNIWCILMWFWYNVWMKKRNFLLTVNSIWGVDPPPPVVRIFPDRKRLNRFIWFFASVIKILLGNF